MACCGIVVGGGVHREGLLRYDAECERRAHLLDHPTPFSDGSSLRALHVLAAGSPAVTANPGDREARLNWQLGAWISIMTSQNGVTKIASLGLPATLRDVGVKTEQVDEIAVTLMHDRWVDTNPRKIDGPSAVRGLLDALGG